MGSGDRLWEIRLKAGVGRFVRFVYAERGGWGVGEGLSAPRRQPLNPCRPEWWCLS